MQSFPQQEDIAHLGISCCIDSLSDIVLESPRLLEYKTTQNEKNKIIKSQLPKSEPNQRGRLSFSSSRGMPLKNLRRSSIDLMSSFTKSSTTIDKKSPGCHHGDDKISPCPSSTEDPVPVPQVSPSEAAQLVAAEYLAGQADGICSDAYDDVGNKEFDELSPSTSIPSLLDASESLNTEAQEGGTHHMLSRTTPGDYNHIPPPLSEEEELLSLEVGHSAHQYLEECFYTEVSVLDRQKFDAIPEIVKSDFTIRVSSI